MSITKYAKIHGVHYNTAAKWVQAKIVLNYRVGRLVRVRNLPPGHPAHLTPPATLAAAHSVQVSTIGPTKHLIS